MKKEEILNYVLFNLKKEDLKTLEDATFILSGLYKKKAQIDKSIFNKEIHTLGFSCRTHNCLLLAKVLYVSDLIYILNDNPKKLFRFKNLGRKSYDEIVEKIIKHEELRKYIFSIESLYIKVWKGE